MQDIYDKLAPVRRKQKLVRTMRYVGVGLIAGALTAVLLALVSSLLGLPVLQLVGWGGLAGGPIVALVLSLLSPSTWAAAAHAVDKHFHLDDRVASAVSFLEQGKLNRMYALQIGDTVARLATLDTAAAVRLRLPNPLVIGAAWVAVAVALLAFLPENQQSNITGDGDSSVTIQESPKDSLEPISPLHAGVSWKPAINGHTVLSTDDAGDIETDAFTGRATTTVEFHDSWIDEHYRTNVSHAKLP